MRWRSYQTPNDYYRLGLDTTTYTYRNITLLTHPKSFTGGAMFGMSFYFDDKSPRGNNEQITGLFFGGDTQGRGTYIEVLPSTFADAQNRTINEVALRHIDNAGWNWRPQGLQPRVQVVPRREYRLEVVLNSTATKFVIFLNGQNLGEYNHNNSFNTGKWGPFTRGYCAANIFYMYAVKPNVERPDYYEQVRTANRINSVDGSSESTFFERDYSFLTSESDTPFIPGSYDGRQEVE
jgi:hypothetical protein